jgi:MFS family permease
MGGAKDQRLYYGWVVAGVTFVSLLASAGIRSAPGVLINPLEAAFGWSRDTIGFAISINLILFGLAGPFAAGLMEWIGVRKAMKLGFLLLALGLFGSVGVRAAWQLVLFWGVVIGGGTGIISMVLAATVATRWFGRHRGLVMGLLTASTATGQLVFLPLLAFMSERLGWRSVPLILGGVAIAILPLILILMRERPADLGLPPLGEGAIVPPSPRARNPSHLPRPPWRRACGLSISGCSPRASSSAASRPTG